MARRSDHVAVKAYALFGYGLMNLVGALLRFEGMRTYWRDFLFLKNPEALVEFTRYVEALFAIGAAAFLLRRRGAVSIVVLAITVISTGKVILAIREGIVQAQRAGRAYRSRRIRRLHFVVCVARCGDVDAYGDSTIEGAGASPRL